MGPWTAVLLLWIAPALVLLGALLRANIRKAARRKAEKQELADQASKRTEHAAAE